MTLKPATQNAGWRVKVSGLKGGHSGIQIHLGRGNALRVLGRLLQTLLEKLTVEVADLAGGSARNAIPREAFAVIALDATKESELKSLAQAAEAEWKADLGEFDPGVKISVEKTEKPAQVLDREDAKKTADLLATMPHGVLAMSPDIADLVQTSTNLATIAKKDGAIEIGSSQRSAIESSKQAARAW